MFKYTFMVSSISRSTERVDVVESGAFYQKHSEPAYFRLIKLTMDTFYYVPKLLQIYEEGFPINGEGNLIITYNWAE